MTKKLFRSLDLYSQGWCADYSLCDEKWDFDLHPPPYSIMGAGRSITGAFFGEDTCVIRLSEKNPTIELDSHSNIVRVSAAATVTQVYNYLIQRKRILKGLPSYPGVTVGGCIAANVHGQHHYREGCFGNHIVSLVLEHPAHGTREITRNEHSDLMDLTIGGFGLTGVIREAVIRVFPIHTDTLSVAITKFQSFLECYESLMADRQNVDYFHGWADLTRLSTDCQKGFYFRGYCKNGRGISASMIPQEKHRKQHLVWQPRLFTGFALKTINKIYYHSHTKLPPNHKTLSDFIFPSKNKLWYFSMFGKDGIIEHQVLVPHEAVQSYFQELNNTLIAQQPFIALCHMKLFRGKQKLLNFDGDGFCLAMHFKADDRSFRTLKRLDQINIEHGVITNIIKDSRVRGDVLKQQYSEFDEFLQKIHLYDPKRLIQNTISQKLFSV